jgi:hypothetical protein
MPSAIEAIGRAYTFGSATLEFTGIPQTYDQLIILGQARVSGSQSNTTGTNLEGQFRINGTWCTNHASAMMNAYYTSASYQSQNNDTAEFIIRRVHSEQYYGNNNNGGAAAFVMEVFNYRDTNSQSVDQIPMYKYQSFSPPYTQGSGGDTRMGRMAGGGIGPNESSPFGGVDGFRIQAGSGNLGAPTQFNIYGVKYS